MSDVPAWNEKPLPRPDPDSREYWRACREHRLLIQECAVCGHLQFYPRVICTACRGRELGWKEAMGTGSVYSYTVVRRPPSDAFAKDVPYVLALIDLDEGVRLMTNVIGCNPEEVVIGMRVGVSFQDVSPDLALPMFSPITA